MASGFQINSPLLLSRKWHLHHGFVTAGRWTSKHHLCSVLSGLDILFAHVCALRLSRLLPLLLLYLLVIKKDSMEEEEEEEDRLRISTMA